MKRILFLFVIINILKVNAQTVFLPNIGTQWHYSFGNYGNQNITNVKVEYIRDSIDAITGDGIKILSTDYRFFYQSNGGGVGLYTFIKDRNDSIWFYNSISNNTWQLLFDFNAIPNQSWIYHANSASYINTYTVTVNSVSTLTINNQSLKSLNVLCKYATNVGFNTYTTTICERIGGMSFLFNTVFYNPSLAVDGDYVDKFLCYEDSTFGLKQFTSYSCYYPALGLNENIKEHVLKTYPNPTKSILNIDIENASQLQNATIQIVTPLGQKAMVGKLEKTIDVTALQNGIYFLQLFAEGKLISTQKIIKE